VYPRKIREARVGFDARNCEKLLGVTIGSKKASALFRSIGIKVSPGKARSIFTIPTWRPDITREIDLVEEAARLYGYDNIETSPRISLALREQPVVNDLSDDAREYLSSAGFREIVTNSMTHREDAAMTEPNPVLIANPLSTDMGALRSSLLPAMLSTVKHNLFNGIESSRFYEIGSVFARVPGVDQETIAGYRENERLCVAIFGLESPVYWGEKPKNATIFTLKGEANALFHRIALDNPVYIPYPTPTALSERPISVELNGEKAGTLGTVSTGLLKRYDIDAEVFFLDVSLDALRKVRDAELRYRPYPRFPVVRRDIAVIVDEETPIGEIESVIRRSAGPSLREIVLFDVYSGEQVGAGKKSCAFSLEFVPGEKTLEQQEIQGLIGGVTESLKSSLGAVLRQKETTS
jgi:phenylalanyl-tRNA synthetase beta chain